MELCRSGCSEEFNDTSSDVVTPEALRCGNISRAAVINDATDTSFEFFGGRLFGTAPVDFVVAPGDGFLRSHAIPETVTGQ